MPSRYFQLNASYFNEQRGIFSKLDMDRLIPDAWRLQQFLDIGNKYPSHYPVFVKPEWGQNSHGIQRADSAADLDAIRKARKDDSLNYLIQSAANGEREFEVFIIPSSSSAIEGNKSTVPAVISITETVNNQQQHYPINGIYNPSTRYQDITSKVDPRDLQALSQKLQKVGHFRISRFGLRANSIKSLINGKFQIIEINLFLPMPLTLLASNVGTKEKWAFCIRSMWHLAKATKSIPQTQPHKAVFFKKLRLSRSLKLTTKVRPYDERA
ncbi:hypothetical protein [Alkalimarinus coralli]|uniref:hypothetical protein n=1 Tax=Alkalimarinus coralli TaxID=2935863 RepID=UPI00202AE300|nr:hypothetical protein [Alkalimarinus coralli]